MESSVCAAGFRAGRRHALAIAPTARVGPWAPMRLLPSTLLGLIVVLAQRMNRGAGARACHHSFHPRESLQRGAVQGALSAV